MATWCSYIVANFHSNNLALLTINSILGFVLSVSPGNDPSYQKDLSPLCLSTEQQKEFIVIISYTIYAKLKCCYRQI